MIEGVIIVVCLAAIVYVVSFINFRPPGPPPSRSW